MMLEIIQTIALVCQIHSGNVQPDYVLKEQLKCTKTLVSCVNPTESFSRKNELNLVKCIKEL